MPTSTFFNLPEEKRQKLLRAAIGEFSRQPYGEVSINRVIQAAEIPRGSFYQYFADKTDLFRYVLQDCGAGMIQQILDCLHRDCGDRLLDLPLALFDRLMARLPAMEEEFRSTLSILRNNVGLDMTWLWNPDQLVREIAASTDIAGMDLCGEAELYALTDLLLSAAAKSMVAVCLGGVSAEKIRVHLECKVALLRRGVEK